MPLLFLLPTIFVGAFLQMAAIANEDIAQALANGAALKHQDLEAQIDSLKQTVALLRDQLADMHKQQDNWQSRAERVSLTASY